MFQPEVNTTKMSTKKCACFTPSGLVYTRLETDGTIARRVTATEKNNDNRNKRSLDNEVYEPDTVESILKENPSIGHLRSRNEYIDETENNSMRDKIDQLIKETEAFIAAYETSKNNIGLKRMKRKAQHWFQNKHKHKNEALVNDNESSLECKIEKDGTVNCSPLIYNDLKAWHTNRLSLEDQIRELRTKLEDLKEIKRHLKITKPVNGNVTEKQTVQPQLINNQIHNRTIVHPHKVHTQEEHHRRGRLGHRLKPKHKNNTSYDKKFRQSNEYILPTVNTQSKSGLFDEQFKNFTTDSTQTDSTIAQVETLNSSYVEQELPKPQVTTVIIENSNSDEIKSTKQDKPLSTTITTYIESSESTRQYEISSTKGITDDDRSHVEHLNPVDFSQKANYFSSAIDKVLSTEKTSTPTGVAIELETDATEGVSSTESTTGVKGSMANFAANLGPKRLDVSEFNKGNTNKASDNLAMFSKPLDIFQKRLHPLYIENEDKHVCYCEENRLVVFTACNFLTL